MKRTTLLLIAIGVVLVLGVVFLLGPSSQETGTGPVTLSRGEPGQGAAPHTSGPRTGKGSSTADTNGATSTTGNAGTPRSGGLWSSWFGGGHADAPKAQGKGVTTAYTERITPASLKDFTEVAFPEGRPMYEGEPVLAYVSVPSNGQKIAVGVSQAGEYPRIYTEPKEKTEVRLRFSNSPPGTKVAVAVQDGGMLHTGKSSALMTLDELGQLAFGFTVSPNNGIHRVSVTTSAGEVKTLNFWAGAPNVTQQAIAKK